MLKRNLIANYLGQGWVALMGLAFIPIYIKHLGAESYGLIGLFAMLQAWLALLDIGMTPTLGREMARFTGGAHSADSIRDLLRSVECVALGMALMLVLGIWAAADWLAREWLQAEKLPLETVAHAFIYMGFVTALRFIEGIYRSCVMGLQRQVVFNVINCISATVRGLGAVAVLVWISPSIEAFFIWQGVVSIATLLILAGVTYRLLPSTGRGGRFSPIALRRVWRFAGGMLAGTLTGLLLNSTDKIVLSKYLTLSEFGYYAFAGTAVSILATMLGPVNQAIFPRFAELMSRRDEGRLRYNFHLSAQIVSVVVGSVGWILFFQAEAILLLWTGDSSLSANTASVFSLLALSALLGSPTWMLYQVQIAYGWTSLGVLINILNILFIVPAFMLVVPEYGMIGAAAILCIMSSMALVLHATFTFQRVLKTQRAVWVWHSVIFPLSIGFVINFIFSTGPFTFSSDLIYMVFLVMLTISTMWCSLLFAGQLRRKVFESFTKLIQATKYG